MKEFGALIKACWSMLGAWTGLILGGVDSLIYAIIALISIDYLTGLISAYINKSLNSEVGFKGILKKVSVLIVVAVANILDIYILGKGGIFRNAVIFYYVGNEGISILENLAKIGLPIPPNIKDALEQLKGSDKDD